MSNRGVKRNHSSIVNAHPFATNPAKPVNEDSCVAIDTPAILTSKLKFVDEMYQQRNNSMDIRGQCFNELKSRMVIDVYGNTITGKYHTGVGEAESEYELVGRISTPNANNGTIAFVVAWQNGMQDTDAVTAWSGEVRDIDGTQYITATWLMTYNRKPFRTTIGGLL
jgi:hypothetical protein